MPDAGAFAAESRSGTVAHADTVVGHLDKDTVAFKAAAQGDGAAVDAGLEAVLDAVLDKRLEQDAGDHDLEGAGSISFSTLSLSVPKRTTSMSR